MSKLGNGGTYRTMCIWYATDLGSGSSVRPTGFSLYTMEHWLVNMVKFPILDGSNTKSLFSLLSPVLFLNVGSRESRNWNKKKNITQVSGCNSPGYRFMLVTEEDGTWSLHRFHLAPKPSVVSWIHSSVTFLWREVGANRRFYEFLGEGAVWIAAS